MEAKALKAHQLWETIETCRQAAWDLDTAQAPGLATRIDGVASYVKRYRHAADAILFSDSMLATMNGGWSQLLNYLSYIPQNVGHVPNANSQLDAIVGIAANWPTPWVNSKVTEGMQAQLDEYVEDVEAARERTQRQLELLSEQLDERDRQIAALENDAQTLAAQVEEQRKSMTDQLTALSSTFNDAQTERTTAFNDWLTDQQDRLADLREKNENDLATHTNKAERVLGQIEELHESVEKVAGKAASAVLARDFSTYSKQQMISAWVAFGVGISLVVLAGVFLLITAMSVGPENTVSWQWIALKLGITATVIGGASFALTLGSRFLKNSTNAKRMDLELRAIGPFLADVGEEQARDTKVNFAERSFGHAWDARDVKADEESLNVGALSQAGDTLVRIIGAVQKTP